MAKRKSSTRKRRTASVIPAETTLRYTLPGDGTEVYLDLMRDISRINRRGMNQGQVVHIQDITLKQDSADQEKGLEATFKTAPLTWVAAQAYMKGREAWMLQQRNVRQETGQTGIRPAYEDFKIYLDKAHAEGGVVLNQRILLAQIIVLQANGILVNSLLLSTMKIQKWFLSLLFT